MSNDERNLPFSKLNKVEFRIPKSALSKLGCRCCLLPAVALVPWLLIGCGTELYESRLDNTRILFAHMELLNEHLLGKWTDPENAVSLRVPLQFALLAPPPPVEKPAQP